MFYKQEDNELFISIKALPKSKKPGIKEIQEDFVKVAVHSPADKGQANAELIKLLSKELDLPRRLISIHSGTFSRLKVIKCKTPHPQKVVAKILELSAKNGRS